jgi:hypothetical protein
MSDITNDNLSDRAYEAMEELTSHPSGIDKRIQEAVDNNDLVQLQYLTAVGEGILAQEDREHTDAY